MNLPELEDQPMASYPTVAASSSRTGSHPPIPIDDEHPFDLDLVASQFTGRALLLRLQIIYHSCPSLRQRCSSIALPTIKAETYDVRLFDELGGDASDPWRKKAQSAAKSEQEKLETELKTVQANLIKESIRMCHIDLAKLHLKTGDYQNALKSFVKTREFNSTPPQMLEMCMSILEIDIQLAQYLQLGPYIVKAESALDRPSHAAASASSHVPLSAAQARQKEEDAARVEEERKKTSTRLQIAKALANLGQGLYERAARDFLAVKGELGDWAKTVVSSSEIAVYGSLCALATLRRSALKSEVLENETFRVFLEEESYIRDIVDAFINGKYKTALDLLEMHSSKHMLIPHLSHHLSNLTASIRRRALIQYFQPFESVKLSRMAAAFGLSEEVVLQEIIELVGSGEIDGRIDLPNKVLHSRKEDPRAKVFQDALLEGVKAEGATRRVMLRMKLVEADLIVKGPKGSNPYQRQEAFEGGAGGGDVDEYDGTILLDED